jgi:hypothetical protein
VISNTRTGGRGLDSSLASLTAILGTLKVWNPKIVVSIAFHTVFKIYGATS